MGHRKAYDTDCEGSTMSNAYSHTEDTVHDISCCKQNARTTPYRGTDIDGMACLHDRLLYNDDCRLCTVVRKFASR